MVMGRNSWDSDYESRRNRKRCKLSSPERRNSRSRSRHRRQPSSPSCQSKRYCGDHSFRKHRRYRGSSGTRTYKRSYDRAMRLEQYYKSKSKKWEHGLRDEDTRGGSRSGGSSRQHSSYNCSSRVSRSKSSSASNKLHSSTRVRDDEDGHLIYRAGDWLQNRYEVRSLLGEGTFGKCLECYDRKRERVLALKIIKNIEKYREAAKLEVKVLLKIAKKDPDQKNLCIQLLSTFNYHGHVCLAFPKLGKSVFDFMKENMYQPYSMSQVQHISYQLLTAVKFLHSIKMTHTDLKPENMLFVDSSYDTVWSENARQDIRLLRKSDIRLIDFGSATFDDEHHSTIVSTRHYRAPEVVLELGWSQPCDIWSCGCIIFELYTGNTLFQTHDNKEHLAMMEHILGPIPSNMIKVTKKTKYFKSGALAWDTKSAEGKYVKENCKTLREYMTLDRYNVHLFDILKEMLNYDSKGRITAEEALRHPYFDSCFNSDRSDGSR